MRQKIDGQQYLEIYGNIKADALLDYLSRGMGRQGLNKHIELNWNIIYTAITAMLINIYVSLPKAVRDFTTLAIH